MAAMSLKPSELKLSVWKMGITVPHQHGWLAVHTLCIFPKKTVYPNSSNQAYTRCVHLLYFCTAGNLT